MLLITQLVLIARAQTTWESMGGNTYHTSKASEVVTAAMTSESTSMDGAQISRPGTGPNPAAANTHPRHRPPEGCFTRWKKLLGLDTFVATASGKITRRRNVFSRGVLTNCKDFWCDPAPYFRRRHDGAAILDGDVVYYTSMYEIPPRMKIRRPRDAEGGEAYHSIGSEDV